MNRGEYESWLGLLDAMVRRLEALEDAVRHGADPRDPRFVVPTVEVSALERSGLELLRGLLPPPATLPGPWHVHETWECCSARATITELLANRRTFRMAWRMYVAAAEEV
jgi:hypothetical protein